MSRSQPYRVRIPVQIIKFLDVSSRITLFLVGQSGPLSFTFKDRLGNKFRTSIGPEPKCSCSPHKNDHCIHTLYVLLKIFRVEVSNPIIWQSAYVDSQLTDLLSGRHTILERRPAFTTVFFEQSNDLLPSELIEKGLNRQQNLNFIFSERIKINEDSVCPICQQSISQEQCLSYCKIKCGNNFHLECLKVWAQHKSTTQSNVTCPMCRASFGNKFVQDLEDEEKQYRKKQAKKMKIKFKCSGCGVDDIPNNVHKCILCTNFQLCQPCYLSKKHIKHPFIQQVQGNPMKWCGATERREEELKIKKFIDNKRKEQNVNEKLLEKLRKVGEDPAKLLDFVASSYPYVSKFISDNIDPYKKLDFDPLDMRCVKCYSTKMIFLRRLSCGHFIDHECLKQNFRKSKFYCDTCGCKLVKGYENLLQKQKQLEIKQENIFSGDEHFNPIHLEKPKEQNRLIFGNQVSLTLREALGDPITQSEQQHIQQFRTRKRLASNLIRNRNQSVSITRPQRHTSTDIQVPKRDDQSHPTNMRIRNVIKPSSSSNHTNLRGNKKTRTTKKEMGKMIELMIGRKI